MYKISHEKFQISGSIGLFSLTPDFARRTEKCDKPNTKTHCRIESGYFGAETKLNFLSNNSTLFW